MISIISGTGCANIIPPSGGPRDSLPPELVAVTPKDSSLNFSAKKISFSFDEYVEVQNLQENLIVSPVPKVIPVIESKLRNVTVQIKDTLEPNTTYSINFGNAIRDINEGNVLKDFTYVFATGSTLDDNELSGKVILAETGKTDSTLTVMLHRSGDDSAIIKERPRYIARLDGTGNFTFRHLPSGSFYIFALKDEGGSLRYLSKGQLIAFSATPVVVTEKTEPVTLYAYIEKADEVKKATPIVPTAREKRTLDKRLRYQTSLDNGQQDILSNFEMQFLTPLKIFDSARVIFADTNYQRITNYSFRADSLMQKLILRHSWKPGEAYNLILGKDFAEDSTGNKLLKSDTLVIRAKKESDYGSLRLRFPTLELGNNPVLQFVQGDKIVSSFRLNTRDFYQKLFPPGEYELRILYDQNGNERWDAGVFFGQHLQPERVQAIDKKVTVKGNWDNDTSITL